MRERIAAVIIVKNEEDHIQSCIESVNWVDEVVVVDTGSTDRTVDAAKRFTFNVYEIEFDGYGDAKNYGMSRATSEWILSLDADERISPQLRDEIEQVLEKPGRDGYYIPRKPFFLGKAIVHGGWYPGYVLRLFRKSKGVFSSRRVHEEVELTGSTSRLRNPILHHTDPSLNHYLAKMNTYTSLATDVLLEEGSFFRLFRLLCNPPFMFLKMYFFKLGFLDGMHGFLLAVLSAFHVFVKYAKLWERERSRNDADTTDM
jgi:glycosyltransferase involved in cell wall biosynthesis